MLNHSAKYQHCPRDLTISIVAKSSDRKNLGIPQTPKEVSSHLSGNGGCHGLARASLGVKSYQLQGVLAQPKLTPPTAGSDRATEDLARRYKQPRHQLPVLWLQATAVAAGPPRCRWSRNASELQQEPLCCQAAAQSGVTGHHQVLSHFSTSRMGKERDEDGELVDGTRQTVNHVLTSDVTCVTRVYRCPECVVLLSQWHSCNFIFLANLYCMY